MQSRREQPGRMCMKRKKKKLKIETKARGEVPERLAWILCSMHISVLFTVTRAGSTREDWESEYSREYGARKIRGKGHVPAPPGREFWALSVALPLVPFAIHARRTLIYQFLSRALGKIFSAVRSGSLAVLLYLFRAIPSRNRVLLGPMTRLPGRWAQIEKKSYSVDKKKKLIS